MDYDRELGPSHLPQARRVPRQQLSARLSTLKGKQLIFSHYRGVQCRKEGEYIQN